MDNDAIVNRVASSALISFDLELLHEDVPRSLLDIAGQLYEGLLLREKDFRLFVKEHNWSAYEGHAVAIICSADAIVPTWAFMLVASALQPYASHIFFGSLENLEVDLYLKKLREIDWEEYSDKKVVVKGCSKVQVPVAAYVEVMTKLRAVAASVMFGEPCSTVPLFKKTRS